MANDELLATLKQDTDTWNAWRQAHPRIRPDLRGTYLRYANLTGADLAGTDLTGAILSGADLSSAFLRRADLSSADLSAAFLTNTNLNGADLSSTLQLHLFGEMQP